MYASMRFYECHEIYSNIITAFNGTKYILLDKKSNSLLTHILLIMFTDYLFQ